MDNFGSVKPAANWPASEIRFNKIYGMCRHHKAKPIHMTAASEAGSTQ
jgi:hypothetical protein